MALFFYKIMNIIYPSKLLNRAVEQLSSLPGIGQKTALRLALHLLKQDTEDVDLFANAIKDMRHNIIYCEKCNNISDNILCDICSNPSRNHSIICVVQSISDVLAIENTAQYNGVYHVLGGVISPINGIGPQDLKIESLINRIQNGEIEEVILALGTTMDGDTTNFFIYRQIKDYSIKISTLSRGVAIGDEIEYADELTLGRSIIDRTNFSKNQ